MITDKEKIELERDFIALLLKHKDLVGDWMEGGPGDRFFDSSHHLLLRAIAWAYHEDSRLTLRSFREYLKAQRIGKLNTLAHEKEFNLSNMALVKKDDFFTIKTKITEAHVSTISIDSIENFRKDIQDKGALFAVKKLSDAMTNLVVDTETQKKIIYESVLDYMPEFRRALEDRRTGKRGEVVKCGIKEIDYAMMVGFAPGTLTLFCADVGCYKTTMMINIALNVWRMAQKNVLFVPLEMPREKMMERILSRELLIPFEKFEKPNLMSDPEKAKINEFESSRALWEHQFFIMDPPERVPVSLIKREIEKHIDIFQPQLVVIDYIANLIPDQRYARERPDLQIGEMLKDLRHMGRVNSLTRDGFAVVSGAQIGREGLKRVRKLGGKTTFHSEDVRGSHEYAADADSIFGQMEDTSQPNSNLKLVVIKARYGRKTFEDGRTTAVLDVRPEMSLIRSKDDAWMDDEKEQAKALTKASAVSEGQVEAVLKAPPDELDGLLDSINEEDVEDDVGIDDFDIDKL